jgi:hypothetical protein
MVKRQRKKQAKYSPNLYQQQTLALYQHIRQSLKQDFQATEEQVQWIDQRLHGILPEDDIHDLFQKKDYYEQKIAAYPTLLMEEEDGTTSEMRFAHDNPISQLMIYYKEKYGKRFGFLYWSAFLDRENPQEFYNLLKMLKKRPQILESQTT